VSTKPGELHIDVTDKWTDPSKPGGWAHSPVTCKAGKAVGDAWLKADGWHPMTLRAAGKTWHRVAKEDYNGGDACANGDVPLGGGPYQSYKTNTYRARTARGSYEVHLVYQWVLEDQETCSGA
jgi:hypothetical protein